MAESMEVASVEDTVPNQEPIPKNELTVAEEVGAPTEVHEPASGTTGLKRSAPREGIFPVFLMF